MKMVSHTKSQGVLSEYTEIICKKYDRLKVFLNFLKMYRPLKAHCIRIKNEARNGTAFTDFQPLGLLELRYRFQVGMNGTEPTYVLSGPATFMIGKISA